LEAPLNRTHMSYLFVGLDNKSYTTFPFPSSPYEQPNTISKNSMLIVYVNKSLILLNYDIHDYLDIHDTVIVVSLSFVIIIF